MFNYLLWKQQLTIKNKYMERPLNFVLQMTHKHKKNEADAPLFS